MGGIKKQKSKVTLDKRIKAWEDLKGVRTGKGGNPSFHKPGSNKK